MTRLLRWGPATLLVAMLIGWSMAAAKAEEPTTAPAKGTITGVVRYDGQPVNGATVRLVKPQRVAPGQRPAATAQAADPANPAKPGKAARAARAAARQQPLATATTDDNGRFTFSDVAPGDYAVAVALKKQANGRTRVRVASGKIANVTVEMRQRPIDKTKL